MHFLPDSDPASTRSATDNLERAMDDHPEAAAKASRDLLYKALSQAAFGDLQNLLEAIPYAVDLPQEVRDHLSQLVEETQDVLHDVIWWRYHKKRLCVQFDCDEDEVEREMRQRGLELEADTWNDSETFSPDDLEAFRLQHTRKALRLVR
jgi:hypothetical protein